MTNESHNIFERAMALPESERAKLAASLIHSLDTDIDADANEKWAAEIKRRIDQIDSGTVELIPFDDVLTEMTRRRNG